jgi:hypothetical protein
MPVRIVYELPPGAQDLTGKVFNLWTVIRFDSRKYYGKDTGHSQWLCECSCEAKTRRVIGGPSLKSGLSKSCGCIWKAAVIQANSTHGFASGGVIHPLVIIHGNMMARCYNPNVDSYRSYGAKGVRVELPWHDCGTFIREMLPTWNGGYNEKGEKLSLDRISSATNYGPGLCKWSTAIEQANNQKSNVPITVNGKTQNIAQWARELGVGPATLATRRNLGWSHEDIILTPIGSPRGTRRKGDQS